MVKKTEMVLGLAIAGAGVGYYLYKQQKGKKGIIEPTPTDYDKYLSIDECTLTPNSVKEGYTGNIKVNVKLSNTGSEVFKGTWNNSIGTEDKRAMFFTYDTGTYLEIQANSSKDVEMTIKVNSIIAGSYNSYCYLGGINKTFSSTLEVETTGDGGTVIINGVNGIPEVDFNKALIIKGLQIQPTTLMEGTTAPVEIVATFENTADKDYTGSWNVSLGIAQTTGVRYYSYETGTSCVIPAKSTITLTMVIKVNNAVANTYNAYVYVADIYKIYNSILTVTKAPLVSAVSIYNGAFEPSTVKTGDSLTIAGRFNNSGTADFTGTWNFAIGTSSNPKMLVGKDTPITVPRGTTSLAFTSRQTVTCTLLAGTYYLTLYIGDKSQYFSTIQLVVTQQTIITPTPEPVIDYGYLKISSNVNCGVYQNVSGSWVYLGMSNGSAFQLKTGNFTFEFRASGYITKSVSLSIRSNVTTIFTADLYKPELTFTADIYGVSLNSISYKRLQTVYITCKFTNTSNTSRTIYVGCTVVSPKSYVSNLPVVSKTLGAGASSSVQFSLYLGSATGLGYHTVDCSLWKNYTGGYCYDLLDSDKTARINVIG